MLAKHRRPILPLYSAPEKLFFIKGLFRVRISCRRCGKSRQPDSIAACAALESDMTHISGFERSQLLLLPETVDDYAASSASRITLQTRRARDSLNLKPLLVPKTLTTDTASRLNGSSLMAATKAFLPKNTVQTRTSSSIRLYLHLPAQGSNRFTAFSISPIRKLNSTDQTCARPKLKLHFSASCPQTGGASGRKLC
jgi:hypothetical protein